MIPTDTESNLSIFFTKLPTRYRKVNNNNPAIKS